MWCSNCGREVSDDAKFCSYCGKKLEAIPQLYEEPTTEEEELHTSLGAVDPIPDFSVDSQEIQESRISVSELTEEMGPEEVTESEESTFSEPEVLEGEILEGEVLDETEPERAFKPDLRGVRQKRIKYWDEFKTPGKMGIVLSGLILVEAVVALLTGKWGFLPASLMMLVIMFFVLRQGKNRNKGKFRRFLSTAWRVIGVIMVVEFTLGMLPLIFLDEDHRDTTEDHRDSVYEDTADEMPVKAELLLKDLLPPMDVYEEDVDTNSKDWLYLNIPEAEEEQYKEFVESCKEKGYVIDPWEEADAYKAYQEQGYLLELEYSDDSETITVDLKAPKELEMLEWPKNKLAKKIPRPDSEHGMVCEDNEKCLELLVGEVPVELFREYVEQCVQKGFDRDTVKRAWSYQATGKDGCVLTVRYCGNDTIRISIERPEYAVKLKVRCDHNLIFSQYDVALYIDDLYKGEIEHGGSETFSLSLIQGTHELRFEKTDDDTVIGETELEVTDEEKFDMNIHCFSTDISITLPDEAEDEADAKDDEKTEQKMEDVTEEEPEDSHPEEKEPEILTTKNCPELKHILSRDADDDDYADFADQYYGRTIRFKGRIDYCAKHGDYNTRFDYLVSAGDYDPDTQRGPSFKFENVAHYDLNTDLDTVSVGLNVLITAEVGEFESDTGLFFLDPISVTGR